MKSISTSTKQVPRGEPIKNPLETEPLNIFVAGSRKPEINVIDNPF
jgi:hypothetical protein